MESKDNSQDIDVQLYWLILKRRWQWLLGILLVSIGLSGFFILKQKPQYRAEGMLLFKSDRISSLTKVGEKIGDLESLMQQGNPLETQALILGSKPLLKEVINSLGLKDKKGQLLEAEDLKIKVEPIVGTDVLKASYTSENPKVAASVVNELMRVFVERNIQSNRTQVFAAGDFLKKQLPASRQELEQSAEALRKFKDQYKVIELPQEASAAINNMAQLDEQINQASATLAEATAKGNELGEKLNLQKSQAVEITSLSQIPGVQETLGDLQKVQAKLVTEKSRYRDNHPSIVNLKEEEAGLNALLKQRTQQVLGSQQISPRSLQIGKIKEDLANQYIQINAESLGLKQKIQTLSLIRSNYQKDLARMPNLEKNLGLLERKLNVAQENYKNLATRLQEIQVAEKQTIGNARVVEPALVPKKAVLSKMTLILLGGGVFSGLLLGMAVAFFIDLIDNSLKTVKETQSFFGYTILGLIPKFEPSNKSVAVNLMGDEVSNRVIMASSPQTVIHKAYQMLQANLKFISHRKVQTIVVTSSVADEGKSEVSANLAAVMAQTGRHVLLIDADMRQPMQHHLWGLINSVGLSNLIVDRDESLKAVQKITKNLSILTAGVQPPNPLALIDSDRMTSLIHAFSREYDYVIFDTPPLVDNADAAVLGKMVDGVLLVTRPGVVNSPGATAAKSLLERSEANVLGMIANAVNIKQEPDSYFYYSQRREGKVTKNTKVGTEQWVYK
jgi:polysaccharide biosynthesis transport protein